MSRRPDVTALLSLTRDPIAQPNTLAQRMALAMTAIDVFTNPELLQRIGDDFVEDLRTRK